MAISVIGEKFNRPGTQTKEKISTTREFQVKTTAGESSLLVLASSDLPEINSGHPDNPKILCTQKQASPETDADTWLVTCSYEPPSVTISVEPGEKKPWDLPAYNISGGIVAYNRPLTASYQPNDTQGNPTLPVLNSAGDPFDPPVEYIDYNSLLKFTYNKRYFDLSSLKLYQNTTNNIALSVLGISLDADEGLITQLSASKIDVSDSDGDFLYSYYQIGVEIEQSNTLHTKRIQDAGFYYYRGVGDKIKIKSSSATPSVLGAVGDEVTEPQLLDGAGGILPIDGDPYYHTIQSIFSRDWSGLGLPKKMEA